MVPEGHTEAAINGKPSFEMATADASRVPAQRPSAVGLPRLLMDGLNGLAVKPDVTKPDDGTNCWYQRLSARLLRLQAV